MQSDRLVFDIGMHLGEDAEFYLLKGFRVVGVEADPLLCDLCARKLRPFVDNGQLTIIQKAIADIKDGDPWQNTVTFYRANVSVCGTISSNREEHYRRQGVKTEAIRVPVISFDEILERFGVPYYIKIDIEGGDIYCLETLARHGARPHFLSVEAEKYDEREQIEQLSLLQQIGYSKFQLTQQLGGFRNQKVTSPAREGKYVEWNFPSAASGLFGLELPNDKWIESNELAKQLKKFAQEEKFWGIDGVQRNWMGKRLHGLVKRILRDPLPGWFDIHAKA